MLLVEELSVLIASVSGGGSGRRTFLGLVENCLAKRRHVAICETILRNSRP